MRASGNGKSVRVFGVPTRKIFDFSCGVDWRITASKAPLRRGTYEKYANPLQGCLFLVLHPNESVRTTGSLCGCLGSPQEKSPIFLVGCIGELLCQRLCRRCSLTSVSSASRQWLFRALHPNESVRSTSEWKGTSRSRFTLTSGAPAQNSAGKQIQQLRRGAGDCSARVLILTKNRCQGREKFCGLKQAAGISFTSRSAKCY